MNEIDFNFTIEGGRAILIRTPSVLKSLLMDLDTNWTLHNEGPKTWSPYDIIGHLSHGEKTDWMFRAKVILELGMEGSFVPFDRFTQFEESKGKNMEELLQEFEDLRKQNIKELDDLDLKEEQLDLKSNHPNLGVVSLRQLLSTWIVHDLVHINQVTRVMAKQYKTATGPWAQYMNLLQERVIIN